MPQHLQREAALQAVIDSTRDRYRTVFEMSGSAIILLSTTGDIREVNPELERLTGYHAEQLRGASYLDLLAPARERERVQRELAQVVEHGACTNFESPLRCANGDERVLLWNARRIDGAGGPEVIAVGMDVTERRRQQIRFTQSEKLSSIGLLAAGVAHEINNPLGGVIACVQALQRDTVPAHRREAYFETVRDGLTRIQQIVRDLLDYARRRPVQPTPVLVAEVIDACLRLIAPAANGKGLVLIHDVEPPELSLVADRSQLVQALMNVLLNAIQASPERGTLRTEARREGGTVVLRVIDHGPGIPEGDLNRVCDPFFSTKEEGEGTGLGLAVTLGIVESHAGQLEIDSQLGEGTRVTLRLPVGDIPC